MPKKATVKKATSKTKETIVIPNLEVPEVPETVLGTEEKLVQDLPVTNYLGTKKIISIKDKDVNGKIYKEVSLEDGTTYLLSERDLNIQLKTV